MLDGLYYLEDLERTTGLLESENHETIGGFVMDLMGRCRTKTSIEREVVFEACTFRILSVKDRRIEKILLTVAEAETEKEGTAAL